MVVTSIVFLLFAILPIGHCGKEREVNPRWRVYKSKYWSDDNADSLDTSESATGIKKRLEGIPGAKQAIIFTGEGCEELDVFTIATVLRRADIYVRVAVAHKYLESTVGINDIMIVPDSGTHGAFYNQPFDIVIIPSGGEECWKPFTKHIIIERILKNQYDKGKLFGVVGHAAELLQEMNFHLMAMVTGPKTLEMKILHHLMFWPEEAVVDGPYVMSCRGTGDVMNFSLTIIRKLLGEKMVKKVTNQLLLGDRDAYRKKYDKLFKSFSTFEDLRSFEQPYSTHCSKFDD